MSTAFWLTNPPDGVVVFGIAVERQRVAQYWRLEQSNQAVIH
jgi:hypothetical protein